MIICDADKIYSSLNFHQARTMNAYSRNMTLSTRHKRLVRRIEYVLRIVLLSHFLPFSHASFDLNT